MPKSKKAEEHPVRKKPVPKARGSSAGSTTHKDGLSLRAFYVRLASDLDSLSRFIADPHAVAKEAGLSEEDTELLFSGDQGRIYVSLRPDLVPSVPLPAQPQGNAPNTGAAAQPAAPASPPAWQQGYGGAWQQGYGGGYPGVWSWPGQIPYGYYCPNWPINSAAQGSPFYDPNYRT